MENYEPSGIEARLEQIVAAVERFQRSRGVEQPPDLATLREAGALSAADLDFLQLFGIEYHPRKLNAGFAGDMFRYRSTGGGDAMMGPRRTRPATQPLALGDLREFLRRHLEQAERPDCSVYIEISAVDVGIVSHDVLALQFETPSWISRMPAIAETASAHGLRGPGGAASTSFIAFSLPARAADAAAAVVAVFRTGCSLPDSFPVGIARIDN